MDGNSNARGWDIFLVKYNSDGVRQWTQQFGTSSNDFAMSITVGSNGSIYLTGHTEGGLTSNENKGGLDIFLVKYSSSGMEEWIQQIGTVEDDYSMEIGSDTNGNLFVVGYTQGILDGKNSAGSDDVIALKFNLDGSNQWAQQIGSSGSDQGRGVFSDSTGNVYLAGQTNGRLHGNSSAGGNDVFILKIDPEGNLQ